MKPPVPKGAQEEVCTKLKELLPLVRTSTAQQEGPLIFTHRRQGSRLLYNVCPTVYCLNTRTYMEKTLDARARYPSRASEVSRGERELGVMVSQQGTCSVRPRAFSRMYHRVLPHKAAEHEKRTTGLPAFEPRNPAAVLGLPGTSGRARVTGRVSP